MKWRLAGLASPGLWLDEILGVRGIGPERPSLLRDDARHYRRAPERVLTRLPFAVAGVVGVAVACLLGRAVSGPWLGVGVGSFVATSPIHLYYSREARPCAYLLLCGFVGLLAVTHLVRRSDRSPWWSLALAGAVAAAVSTSANAASP